VPITKQKNTNFFSIVSLPTDSVIVDHAVQYYSLRRIGSTNALRYYSHSPHWSNVPADATSSTGRQPSSKWRQSMPEKIDTQPEFIRNFASPGILLTSLKSLLDTLFCDLYLIPLLNKQRSY
jgi:hypothetical protein